jgi:hypothetical protein
MAAAAVTPGARLPSDFLVAIPVFVMVLVGLGIATITLYLALLLPRALLPGVGIVSLCCSVASFGFSFYLASAVLHI